MSGVGEIQVAGHTRGAFLARSVLGATALYGAAAVGPALTRALAHEAHGAFGGGDAGIVNFALTLEKVEAELYKRALAANVLEERVKKVVELVAKEENEHVQALTRTLQGLGGKADPAPQVRLPAFGNQDDVLRTATEIEDMAVYAYNGAATQIDSADVLQAMASIAQVEARHAGALRELHGQTPTVSAFDRVFSGAEADEALHRIAR
jgi:rubrerythrin